MVLVRNEKDTLLGSSMILKCGVSGMLKSFVIICSNMFNYIPEN